MTRCEWCKEPENIEKLKELCIKKDRTWREIEQVANFCKKYGEISPLSSEAIKPLIREKDPEIREKAIESVKKSLDLPKDANTGRFKKKITVKDTRLILKDLKIERAKEKCAINNQSLGYIVHGDSIDLLNKIEDKNFDLLLTDPPYITEIGDYEDFLTKWLPKAIRKIKDTGRIYIFCSSHPKELLSYLDVFENTDLNGFTLANLLVWHYQNNLGPAPTHTFKRGWQGIFYLYGKNASQWDSPLTKDLFDHFNYSLPDGRHELKYHSHQKSEELIRHLIELSSNVGDKIFDLFAGSGVIGLTASKLGRYCFSIEKNQKYVDICIDRGLIRYEL